MNEFTIIYRNGKSRKVVCAGKKELIRRYFENDNDSFRKQVRRLIWDTLTIRYTEDVDNEEINASLTTADINPYGWRNR